MNGDPDSGMTNGLEEDSDNAQQLYVSNVFVGVGRGDNRKDAEDAAYDDAWGKAKNAGKAGRPLRVEAIYVGGENPINWCKVVLTG